MTAETAQAHPDADLLTAFAEQTLADSERGLVMEHLARCGDCRDVVALALPATEDIVVASPESSVRHGWFAWPVVRWGTVAAGILLVAGVGIIQYKQRAQQNVALVSSPVHQEEKTPTPLPSAQPTGETPATRAAVPPTSEIAKQTPEGKPSRAQATAVAEQPGASANTLFPSSRAMHGAAVGRGFGRGIGSGSGQGVRRNYQGQSTHDSLAFAPEAKEAMTPPNTVDQSSPPVQQAAIPPSSQMVAVQSESAQVEVAQNRTELPAQNGSSANLDVVKAKDSVPAQAAPTVPGLPNVALQSAPSLMQRASPRWTINAVGGLQRSFDAGKTWEDVLVMADGNARSLSLARSSQKQSVAEYKDEYKSRDAGSKKVAETQTAPVFRAVAATGPEVWAGGSGAMLYHSGDSGTHWTRVTPTAGGASLTGDVIGIQFSDAGHGMVITSNSERWSTADAGQTWQKQ